MYLFFDTETTGTPKNYQAPASDLKNWPRLVQLAWMLMDEQEREVSGTESIIKPDGFRIPADAARIHGITTELALKEGAGLRSVLQAITASMQEASVLVAHNLNFDAKVLGAEFLRSGLPNLAETKAGRCTMVASTDLCRLPGRYGYKWPTLQELHRHLFGEAFEGAHRAMVDLRACARCYFELKRRRVIA